MHCFIQTPSADENDKDDDYDSKFFSLIGTLKFCTGLNKEKGFASFRNPVTMRTIRTMIWLHPKPLYYCLRNITRIAECPCWSLCDDMCDSFKEIGKYPPQDIQGLNRRFQRNTFPNHATPPYAQNLRRIKQRKGLCFIQETSDDEDDQGDDMRFLYCRFLHLTVSRS